MGTTWRGDPDIPRNTQRGERPVAEPGRVLRAYSTHTNCWLQVVGLSETRQRRAVCRSLLACSDWLLDWCWKPEGRLAGYMRPGAVRNMEWLKKARRIMPRSLILRAHSAGGDELGDVRNHGGPPKTLSDEGLRPTGARMAGESRGMGPFKDRRMDRVREKHPFSRAHPWDPALYTPHECSRQT